MADDRASLRLVMLGAPGSGKGTQAAILARRFGIPSISTGEMLRQAVADETPLGRRVKAIMSAGRLVDDATMAEVVEERLAQADAQRGFILDGYPRTRSQADTLAAILARKDWTLDSVVYLDVPEAELVSRALARQRADDQEDVIRQRLNVYREQTAPLVEHYASTDLLRRVDGNRPIETVAESLVDTLRVAS